MPSSPPDHSPQALSLAPPRIPAWVSNLGLLALLVLLWPLAGALNENLNPYYFQILIIIGINVIMATSLNLINGITGQFSLGHAGFMAVGAYGAGVVFKHYFSAGWSGWTEAGAFLGVLTLGGLLAAGSGLLVGIPTLRLGGDYLAIATLGFGEIIVLVIENTNYIRIPFTKPMPDTAATPPWNVFDIGGASGLHGIPQPQSAHYFFWTYGWVVISVVTIWRLVYSPRGKAFLAVREDEIAARAVGIDTTRQKVLAFILGGFFAGVAGGLSAMWNQNLDPAGFNFMKSIDYVVMVVLGGSGSITGVILAAVVLTWLPEQLRAIQQWRMVIYSLLLIVMMLIRPEGLLGRRELWWTRRRIAPKT
ncbi:MAG TPA: branched-chain amino acid ABC transporter permease [Tepidisphaeraceae bacterium]|jgi:branched-chain amino acid transport system permease protein|nr:branched-chain amino acid ABC transporter permease [Tepidisphaeraceae bacterium]